MAKNPKSTRLTHTTPPVLYLSFSCYLHFPQASSLCLGYSLLYTIFLKKIICLTNYVSTLVKPTGLLSVRLPSQILTTFLFSSYFQSPSLSFYLLLSLSSLSFVYPTQIYQKYPFHLCRMLRNNS